MTTSSSATENLGLPLHLLNALAGPLPFEHFGTRPPGNTVGCISFAGTEPSVNNSKARRLQAPKIFAQRPGRVGKASHNQSKSLPYRPVFTCEQCQFSCSICVLIDQHLHPSAHFDLFAKNNLHL